MTIDPSIPANLPRLENLTDLAEFLKTLPANDDVDAEVGFDMTCGFIDRENTDHPCGTASCIGGWVNLCNPETRDEGLVWGVSQLGSDWDEAYALCHPDDDELDDPDASPGWYATPQQAARAVEILRDTGKCDWPRALREA